MVNFGLCSFLLNMIIITTNTTLQQQQQQLASHFQDP